MGPLPGDPVPPVDNLMESPETVTLHPLPNQDQGHAADDAPPSVGGGGPPEERGAERIADIAAPRRRAPHPSSGQQSTRQHLRSSPLLPTPSEPSEGQQSERSWPR